VVEGASVAAAEVRAAYDHWCATRGLAPLSMKKLADELEKLGYEKWKSDGRMRFRDLQFVA